MLKNIKYHLHEDEEEQLKIEYQFSKESVVTFNKNKDAFLRNIPAVIPYLTNLKMQNISVFCNKNNEANIVNISNGRTLYGLQPCDEISQQLANFKNHAPQIALKEMIAIDHCNSQLQRLLDFGPVPKDIECLIVFGIGSGQHISELIKDLNIKHIIIYEPESQYFQCSCFIVDWASILKTAGEKSTNIYLQLQKDGRQLPNDLEELTSVYEINKAYVYKHYNHIVFNNVEHQLCIRSYEDITKNGFTFSIEEKMYDFCPLWTEPVNITNWLETSLPQTRFSKNLEAFKRYYPDVYQSFSEYNPKKWFARCKNGDEINLFHKDFAANWYSDTPKADCELSLNQFRKSPNRDGVVLDYNMDKLAHYIHYRLAAKNSELLKEAEDVLGNLHENVESIIFFGLGCGYQLEQLVNGHSIENLFICEPNLDFFYASLYSIDWERILKKVWDEKGRIYINLGESSGQLIQDLMKQFYSIGPYILNNTYFYQTYYNSTLNKSIAQLREQLQIVISMGEYFDHAYYGIAHTQYSIKNNHHFLLKEPHKKLTFFDKEVPIFVIGNGPSIDISIDQIKECQDNAILISCGSSLRVLYKNGITPDFHAEIEQNRTTFDWASLIGDPKYLKRISLISCNGIHPDTTNIYKDVYVTFKEGESSTVSACSVFGEDNFEILKYAFPTVSNFIINLVSKLGFHNIYLFGIDLGFINPENHHSRLSSYYNSDGTAKFDYSSVNNTTIVVPGNFRETVFTKNEFHIAKQMMEQSIAEKAKNVMYFNCSDGARIFGTEPLKIDNILLSNEASQKLEVLEKIKTKVFSDFFANRPQSLFSSQYSHKLLTEDMSKMRRLITAKLDDSNAARTLVRNQQKCLIDAYKDNKSLLFYYLHGTVNYVNAVLTKLTNSSDDPHTIKSLLNTFQQNWVASFDEIARLLQTQDYEFDTCQYSVHERHLRYNEHILKTASVAIITDSSAFCIGTLANIYNMKKVGGWDWTPNIQFFVNESDINSDFDYVIFCRNFQSNAETSKIKEKNHIYGRKATLHAVPQECIQDVQAAILNQDTSVSYLVFSTQNDVAIDNVSWRQDVSHLTELALLCVIQEPKGCVVFPKYPIFKSNGEKRLLDGLEISAIPFKKILKYSFFLIASFNESIAKTIPNGDRGITIFDEVRSEDLTLGNLTQKEFMESIQPIENQILSYYICYDILEDLQSQKDIISVLDQYRLTFVTEHPN